MTHRLDAMFERLEKERRTGIFPYLTVGFPSIDDTLVLVPALAQAGADLIELGVPFSDPIADGPIIQAASFEAIKQGTTLALSLTTCKKLRDEGLQIPVIFMGYYNPILNYGIDKFAEDAASVGADGAIVPDLPPEEASNLREALSSNGLPLITLLTPTSTEKRIQDACSLATGFIYCVAVAGVTGIRSDISSDVFELLKRIRKYSSLPIAVGFGISKRDHVKRLDGYAQAAVVGSALIDVINSASAYDRTTNASRFLAELSGYRDKQN